MSTTNSKPSEEHASAPGPNTLNYVENGDFPGSLEDDDFELISSVHEDMGEAGTLPGIPLSGISILPMPQSQWVQRDTTVLPFRDSLELRPVVGIETEPSELEEPADGDRTPILQRSVDGSYLGLNGGLAAAVSHRDNTVLLDSTLPSRTLPHSVPDVTLPSEIRSSLTISSATDNSEKDAISMIESIRAEYNTAQDVMLEENRILREACQAKSDEIAELKRRLEIAAEEKLRMDEELSKNEALRTQLNLKYDELFAEKTQSDDIIKIHENTIRRLREEDGGPVVTSVGHTQQLMSSLRGRERQLDESNAQLDGMRKLYQLEHEKVLDLQEIVSVLHEQNVESEQLLHRAQREFRDRVDILEEQLAKYVERGEVNNV